MTEQHAISAQEALAVKVFCLLVEEELQTLGEQRAFCYAVADLLVAALDEREKLRAACENAEQTLRNLSLGFLTGDAARIALNEANNLHIALEEGGENHDNPLYQVSRDVDK